MTKQFYQPIETHFGILKGRDTIFIETIALSLYPRQLKLSGTINGSNVSHNPDKLDLHYTLIFHQVLTLKMVELDSWDWVSPSCFAEVIDSEWLASLKGKVTSDHKHYF